MDPIETNNDRDTEGPAVEEKLNWMGPPLGNGDGDGLRGLKQLNARVSLFNAHSGN